MYLLETSWIFLKSEYHLKLSSTKSGSFYLFLIALFWNNFRLTEKLQITEFPNTFHMKVLYNHSTMIKTKQLILIPDSWLTTELIRTSPVFPLMSFFCSIFPSRIQNCIESSYDSLLSSDQWQFLSLIFHVLDTLKCPSYIFCGNVSFEFVWCCLVIKLRLCRVVFSLLLLLARLPQKWYVLPTAL